MPFISKGQGRKQDRLRHTSVKKKETASCLPYFKGFSQHIAPHDSHTISTRDLHVEYLCYVRKQTDDKIAVDLASGFRRFALKLDRVARDHGWVKVERPKRGYQITIGTTRQPRKSHGALAELHRVLSPPVVKFIDRQRGHGCFATADYLKGDIVCDYLGQIINKEEKIKRENVYDAQNISYRIIDLPVGPWPKHSFLDGTRDENGVALTLEQNPGASLNHSAKSPNCRLMRIQDRVVLVAMTGIPCGMELTWDYSGERHKSDPEWMKTN